jgi:glycosyltransferase involved in cell wall biosynthesis
MHRPLNEPYYDPADVLMVGLGASAVMYYRVLLPAHALGVDYVGVTGEPPEVRYRTGLVGGESAMPDFARYKLVVLQQPRGEGWLKVIRAMQARGTVVVYEVDDWLHAIKNTPGHAFAEHFRNHDLAEYERCMKACDAMIVSTPFLASAYRPFIKRIFVCENGIDAGRYDLTRPGRSTVNVGWAGATGHQQAVLAWLNAIGELMEERPFLNFVSIGQPYAEAFHAYFGERRAIATPFAAIEQYPAAMTMLDVAIAPAGSGGFHKAKSDLRWLEAGALGIPLVGHPDVYPNIEHGVTGFHARTGVEAKPLIAELVDDDGLRTTVGENARTVVRANRDINVAAEAWRRTFGELSRTPQLADRVTSRSA